MEAMQDLRLLHLLETKIGRKAVVKLIHKGLDHELKMGDFPLEPDYLKNLHESILKKLDSCAE